MERSYPYLERINVLNYGNYFNTSFFKLHMYKSSNLAILMCTLSDKSTFLSRCFSKWFIFATRRFHGVVVPCQYLVNILYFVIHSRERSVRLDRLVEDEEIIDTNIGGSHLYWKRDEIYRSIVSTLSLSHHQRTIRSSVPSFFKRPQFGPSVFVPTPLMPPTHEKHENTD